MRSSTRRKTLPSVDEPNLPRCHVTATDRQKSRSLGDIQSIDDLQTTDDGSAERLLLVWRLGRYVPIDSKLLEVYHTYEPKLRFTFEFWASLDLKVNYIA